MTDDARELEALMQRFGASARAAAQLLARASAATKGAALEAMARRVDAHRAHILEANAADCRAAERAGEPAALLERLRLDEARVDAMIAGVQAVRAQTDPVGAVIAEWERPNGLRIQRVRTPIGVIAIVYESRPNVTVDAAALCLQAGNAVILRGGSESLASNQTLHRCIALGLGDAGLPAAAVQLVPTSDRAAVGLLLAGLGGNVDLLVPRGGRGLVERVRREARVPVLGHLEGNCHVYLHAQADPQMARALVLNAKLRRTGVCGAAESLLIDRAWERESARAVVAALLEAGCEVRGDEWVRALDARVRPAVEGDWSTEYLAPVISACAVAGLEEAVAHIARYGSGHTEAIVTRDEHAAARFLAEVDSAIVLHNASTQFADGAEFGMGAEIGIATDRLHARGPVGVEQLTTFKYVVHGAGQVRP